MRQKSGLVFDIRHFSVHDGTGIRTTVFLKGCPLNCIWCHNPESILFAPETFSRHNRINDKTFEVTETVGTQMSVEEVMSEIEKDILIYDDSKGGVTFSGGEPLAQPDFLLELLNACTEKEIHTAVDTSGHANAKILEKIMPFTNLFLFDLKLANQAAHKQYTGVSNTQILKNLDLIYQAKKEIIIRIPLIPEITDTEQNLETLRKIIAAYPTIKRVDILPFHNIAKSKYERFGKDYILHHSNPYDPLKAEEIAGFFRETVETVSVGG